jgi:hypothetical protein
MKFHLVFLFPLLLVGSIKQPVEVTTTDRVAFAPGGTIRLSGSVGQLNIEGWDRPEVEISLTRYTESDGPAREQVTKELGLIHVSTRGRGTKELVISTEIPARNPFARFFDGRTKWNLDYRIRVPRDSKLVVQHDGGDLTVYDVAGDIDVHAPHGSVMLLLPDGQQYSIDAKCVLGDVYSDFDASTKPAGARQIDVRVRSGTIKILEMERRLPTGAQHAMHAMLPHMGG